MTDLNYFVCLVHDLREAQKEYEQSPNSVNKYKMDTLAGMVDTAIENYETETPPEKEPPALF